MAQMAPLSQGGRPHHHRRQGQQKENVLAAGPEHTANESIMRHARDIDLWDWSVGSEQAQRKRKGETRQGSHGAVRKVVGIRGAISSSLRLSDQAARSIG